MSEGSPDASEVAIDIASDVSENSERVQRAVRQPVKFSQTLEGKALKVSLEAAKLGGKGAVEIGKGAVKVSSAVVRGTWKDRRDLSLVGVGMIAGAALVNPEGARNISHKAIEGTLNKVENIRNIGDKMPSETAYDNLVKQNGEVQHTEYGDVTSDQLQIINIAIDNEKKHLDSIISADDWANIFKNEDLIRETARKYNLDEKYFLGMVILESHGDSHAESGVGAAGLAQLMPEFAKKFGLKVVEDDDPQIAGMTDEEIKTFRIANDERYDPEKNLDAAAKSIAGNIDKFKDVLIAYQVHHDGDVTVFGAIQKVVYDRDGYRLPDIVSGVSIGDDSPEGQDANYNEALRELGEYQGAIQGKSMVAGVDGQRIGIVNLYATREFTGEGTDSGDKYAWQIVGGSQLYVLKRSGIDKISSGQ